MLCGAYITFARFATTLIWPWSSVCYASSSMPIARVVTFISFLHPRLYTLRLGRCLLNVFPAVRVDDSDVRSQETGAAAG